MSEHVFSPEQVNEINQALGNHQRQLEELAARFRSSDPNVAARHRMRAGEVDGLARLFNGRHQLTLLFEEM